MGRQTDNIAAAFGVPQADKVGLSPHDSVFCDLRILATTDLHGRVRAYDYERDRTADTVGLSRLATLIRAARGEVSHALLFDGGDSLFGTALTDLECNSQTFNECPMAKAMATLEYDALALGNHDFDQGLQRLSGCINAIPVPVVATNYDCPGLDGLSPEIVLSIQPKDGPKLRVGVLAFLPPNIGDNIEGLLAQPTANSALARSKALRKDGVDLIVGLFHGSLDHDPEMTEVVTSQFDVLIEGHNHRVFKAGTNSAEDPAPARVEPGFWGSHLGVIDLRLQLHDGRWSRVRTKSEVRAIVEHHPNGATRSRVEDDQSVQTISQTRHDAVCTYLAEPISHTAEHLFSHLSLLGPNRLLDLVSEAQLTEARRLVGPTDLPFLSAVSPQRMGGHAGPYHYVSLAPGPLARRDLNRLYSFPNRVSVVKITGADVREWLNEATRPYLPLVAGKADQMLFDFKVPSYSCDRLVGLDYDIDLTAPHQATNIRYQGRPLADDQDVLVATSDFRTDNAGDYSWLRHVRPIARSDALITDLIVKTLASGPIPQNDSRFRLLWPEGASVLTQTGPEFRRHTHNYPDYQFDDLTDLPSGFMTLRIRPRATN